jgi:DNA-3-methyladenine glycosylase II
MTPEAHAHLSKSCKVMRRLIRMHGPCGIEIEHRRSPFESLVSAVAHQQLHGKAAQTILGRFRALFAPARFPTPEQLASVSDDALRACGFSRAKTAAIRDIAEKTIAGVVPTSRAIAKLSDEEIITRLTTVRGVGRWTVEMLLIFKLGRPDVLPVDDFGVRNGFRVAYGLPAMPTPKELLVFGERWRPHATTAAWYLWRAADNAAPQRKPSATGKKSSKPAPKKKTTRSTSPKKAPSRYKV